MDFTYGMEIEQLTEKVPDEILYDEEGIYWGRMHTDGSGIKEAQVYPKESTIEFIREFLNTARQSSDRPWTWRGGTGGGICCGSHAHIGIKSQNPEKWQRMFNTFVELVPIFAPFFCHNWEKGFRGGNGHRNWASPSCDTFSVSRMGKYVDQEIGYGGRSVSLDGSTPSKPLTFELRINDAHPVMAMTGLEILTSIGEAAYENEAPELKSGEKRGMYDRIDGGHLITSMNRHQTVNFINPIPGVPEKTFDSMWECLEAIIGAYQLVEPEHVAVIDRVLNRDHPGDWMWSVDREKVTA